MTGAKHIVSSDMLLKPGRGEVRARFAVTGVIPDYWCVALVLLTCVPLLYPTVPPLTDLPAHMARYLVQTDAGRSSDLTRWYSFHWNVIPNLGADLVAQVLVPRLGLEPTLKCITLLVIALQASGYLALSRAAHGRVTMPALFALPLAYGNPFQYGFLNFTLSVALATLALALWISPFLAARPRQRWVAFCFIASATWLCHLAGWAVLCVMIGCAEFVTCFDRSRKFGLAVASAFVACTCMFVPQLASMVLQEAPARLPTTGFFELQYKFYYLLNVLADRWILLDYLSVVAILVLLILSHRSKVLIFDRRLGLAAIVLLLAFFATPSWVFGSFYADMRLLPTVFALAVLSLRPDDQQEPRSLHLLAILGIAFFAVRIGSNTVSMAFWDRQIRAQIRVLDAVPVGSQLLTFNARPCKDVVLLGHDRNTHIASYALTKRRAFANDQFEMSGGQLLKVSNPAMAPFETDPSNLEIGEQCQGHNPLLATLARIPPAARHLWIIWSVPEQHLPGWAIIARAGRSVLYGVEDVGSATRRPTPSSRVLRYVP